MSSLAIGSSTTAVVNAANTSELGAKNGAQSVTGVAKDILQSAPLPASEQGKVKDQPTQLNDPNSKERDELSARISQAVKSLDPNEPSKAASPVVDKPSTFQEAQKLFASFFNNDDDDDVFSFSKEAIERFVALTSEHERRDIIVQFLQDENKIRFRIDFVSDILDFFNQLHFYRLVFNNEGIRTDIFKEIGNIDADRVLKNIDLFYPLSVDTITSTMKHFAVNHPAALAGNIDHLGIKDEKLRIELALIVARQLPSTFITCFDKFKIPNAKGLMDIYLLYCREAPHLMDDIHQVVLNAASTTNITDIYKSQTAKTLWSLDDEYCELETELHIENDHSKAAILRRKLDDKLHQIWFRDSYFFVCEHLSPTDDTLQKQLPYIQAILQLEDELMRYSLMAVLVQIGPPEDKLKEEGRFFQLYNLLLTPFLRNGGITRDEHAHILKFLTHADYNNAKTEHAMSAMIRLLYAEDYNFHEKGLILKEAFKNLTAVRQEVEKKDKEAANDKTSNLESEKNKKTAVEQPKGVLKKQLQPHVALQMLDLILETRNAYLFKKTPVPNRKESDEKQMKSAVSSLKQPIDIAETLKRCFQQCLGIEPYNEFEEQFSSTIGKCRNPSALLIYAAKLSTHPDCKQKKYAWTNPLGLLRQIAFSILDGTYKAMRYHPNSHLNTVFKDNEALKAEWQKGESLSLGELKAAEEAMSAAGKPDEAQLKDIHSKETAAKAVKDPVWTKLNQCIIQFGHLDAKLYPRFGECMQFPNKINSVLNDCAKEKIQNEQKGVEVALIKLLNPKKSDKDKAILIEKALIPNLIKLYKADAQIVQDMSDLSKTLKLSAQASAAKAFDQEYTMIDTDDWADMLLSGTEVAGSCLRIDGDVYWNICLLAFLADGKIRMIAVKDKSGKIIARCIMRILWNEDDQVPVLFQEQLYMNDGVPDQVVNAIDLMFARRARKLKLDLVRSAGEADSGFDLYPHNLHSRCSHALIEYVDAIKDADKKKTIGIFNIPACDILLVQQHLETVS